MSKQPKPKSVPATENQPTLADILKTSDPKQQVQVASQLVQLAQTPVISMVIQADLRSGNVDYKLIGLPQTDYELLYKILEAVRQSLFQSEREAALAKVQPSDPEEASEL